MTPIHLIVASAPAQAPRAVWLSGPDDLADGTGVRFLLWAAGALTLAVAVGGFVSWLAWRDERRYQPAERAGRAVARGLGVSAQALGALTRLARGSGVPLAAIVLSESAFESALAKLQRASGEAIPAPQVDEVRRRLFAPA